MEYLVLSAQNGPALTTYVGEAILEGWTPFGGITANDKVVHQAMVREPVVCMAAPVQLQVSPDHADKVRVLIAEYGMASSEWGKHWADTVHTTFGEAYENALKTRAALFMILGVEDK